MGLAASLTIVDGPEKVPCIWEESPLSVWWRTLCGVQPGARLQEWFGPPVVNDSHLELSAHPQLTDAEVLRNGPKCTLVRLMAQFLESSGLTLWAATMS